MKSFKQFLYEADKLKLTKAAYKRSKFYNQISMASRGVQDEINGMMYKLFIKGRGKEKSIRADTWLYYKEDDRAHLSINITYLPNYSGDLDRDECEKYYNEANQEIKNKNNLIQKSIAKIIKNECDLEEYKDYTFDNLKIDAKIEKAGTIENFKIKVTWDLIPILSDEDYSFKITKEQRKAIVDDITNYIKGERKGRPDVSFNGVTFIDNVIAIKHAPTPGLIDRIGSDDAERLSWSYAEKYFTGIDKILKKYDLSIDKKAHILKGRTTKLPVKKIY